MVGSSVAFYIPADARRQVVYRATFWVMLSTFDQFTYGDGEYFLERAVLHAGIHERLLEGRPRHSPPEALFLAGGPAAGKTTLLNFLTRPPDAVLVDLDRLREEIPEYAELRDRDPEEAANLTQREAGDIVRQGSALALVRRHNVVLDQVGGDDDGQFTSRLRAALHLGYRVRVCYATVSLNEALAREQRRFESEGRRVPAGVLRRKHAQASRGLAAVAAQRVDRIEIYDMTEATPELIAFGAGGRGPQALEVVNPGSYAAFVEKGHA